MLLELQSYCHAESLSCARKRFCISFKRREQSTHRTHIYMYIKHLYVPRICQVFYTHVTCTYAAGGFFGFPQDFSGIEGLRNKNEFVIHSYFRHDVASKCVSQIPGLFVPASRILPDSPTVSSSVFLSFFFATIDNRDREQVRRDLLLFTRDTRGGGGRPSKDLKEEKQTLLIPLSPSQIFLLAAHKF